MVTSGLWGFRKNGTDLLTFNYTQSYPRRLGGAICSFVREMSDKEMEKLVSILKPVSKNDTATLEDLDLFKQMKINIGKDTDYYWALWETQGNFAFYEGLVKNPPSFMKGKKFPFIEDNVFILDSMRCEYAYVLNLDKYCLEFWVGFQEKPDSKNRYGTEETPNGYFPCKKLEDFSFKKIRDKGEESIVKEMEQLKIIPEIKRFSPLSGKILWKYVEKYMPKDEIDHHGNGNGLDDLYLKKTRFSQTLVDHYQYKDNVSTFRSQIDGSTWYDLPFLYPIVEKMN